MRIASAGLAMASSSSVRELSTTTIRQTGTTLGSIRADVGQKGQTGLSFFNLVNARRTEQIKHEEQDNSSRIRQSAIMMLLDFLLGVKSKDRNLREIASDEAYSAGEESFGTSFLYQEVEYEETTAYMKECSSTFDALGVVRTEDGREISFNMHVGMTSRFEEYRRSTFVQEEAIELTDPLVINLDGNVTSVSDQTFLFDLDADGEKEEIHRLSAGSGFLALDQNGNGEIDDGSELFGTRSGNGFADLAKYDEDGNGWIDENDRIFDQLKIWSFDDDGKPTLYSLKEKDVGAICLSSAPTYCEQYDKFGNVMAAAQRTGMFLFESGAVGTVQHVDMAT